MTNIAGGPTVAEVMERLQALRPVFHSEADFQHAFGQTLHDLDSSLQVRLEAPQGRSPQGRAEYLDLLCFGPQGRTAIEFKYFTAPWAGVISSGDGVADENFKLMNHAATDLARRNYVFDIARLERFVAAKPGTDGIAILLTNARHLWSKPTVEPTTRDREFRIHEDTLLSGTLRWADGMYPGNTRHLSGSYPMAWQPYSDLPGLRGEFRWLAVAVMPSAASA